MKARRIAFISEHASPLALLGSEDAGGQNVYVDEVSRHLAHLGHAVDIFSRRESRDVDEVVEWAPNVRVINVAAGPPAHVFRDDLWPLMPEFRDSMLRHCLRERDRYDVVHGHFWMSGWVATQLRGKLRVPAVQTFHATGVTKRRHQGENDTSPAERIAVERQIVHLCDRVIAQCPAEERELISEYGAQPSRVSQLPAGVNPQRFRPVEKGQARHALGLPADVPVIGYVGRMLPRKDIRNIVRALGVLRDGGLEAKLLIVGGETEEPDPRTTPEIGALQDLARELDVLDRVIFTGKRQQDLLWLYYGASDVMVTTPWYEPFGLTPLEAMACGRPVVGSDVGGISYTIEDGVSGYLVPPRNPTALADRLRAVIKNQDLRRQMGRAGRRRVEREFTWMTTAMRLSRLYETMLKESVLVEPEREKTHHAVSRQTFRGRLAHIREGATFWN